MGVGEEEYMRGLHGYGNRHSDGVPPGLDCRLADGKLNANADVDADADAA